ncbi:unnamed protein product [Meganyctiphanes norvegica]|uniref:Uncharacterized protein n=1 Tax=Meganyctiphanes norvegica TaxID=48144 RepID=A0AAV2R6U5_MEGNR
MGDSDDDEKSLTVVRNATDLQRLKLEKLMKNPDKIAVLVRPQPSKKKKSTSSVDFRVPRILGRKTSARTDDIHMQVYMCEQLLVSFHSWDEKDFEYHLQIEMNRKEAEDKTTKKRNKRQRRKEKMKAKRQKLKEMKIKGLPINQDSSSSEELTESEEENEPDDKTKPSKEENEPEMETKQSPESEKNQEKTIEIDNEGEK